jgi:hypothetical protein
MLSSDKTEGWKGLSLERILTCFGGSLLLKPCHLLHHTSPIAIQGFLFKTKKIPPLGI